MTKKLLVLTLVALVLISGCTIFRLLAGSLITLNELIEDAFTASSRSDDTGYHFAVYWADIEEGVRYQVELRSPDGETIHFYIRDEDTNYEYFDLTAWDSDRDNVDFDFTGTVKVVVTTAEANVLSSDGSVEYAFAIRTGGIPILTQDDAEWAMDQINGALNSMLGNIATGSYSGTVVSGTSGSAAITGSMSGSSPGIEIWDFAVTFANYGYGSDTVLNGSVDYYRRDYSRMANVDTGYGTIYTLVTDTDVTADGAGVMVTIDDDDVLISDTVSFDVVNYNDNQFGLVGTLTGSEGTFTID